MDKKIIILYAKFVLFIWNYVSYGWNFVSYGWNYYHMGETMYHMGRTMYSRLSLTQLCITQYYHLSRPDGPVPEFSPIYYCNSTTIFLSTAKSIKLITRYEKLDPLIKF